MVTKRQRWSKGAVLSVPFNGGQAYAQMLDFPEMAFFSDAELSNFLFRIWVHKYCYSTGHWLRCGKAPVSAELQEEVQRFSKDRISGKYSIWVGSEERAASYAECQGLERAAVWDANHVEDRLADLAAGRENKWLNQLSA